MSDITSYKLASVIARVLDDNLGKDIAILDISKVSVIADYFVIVSGDTSTQVKALTSHVREKMKKWFSFIPTSEENDLKNRWNLLDYGDVVVHILQKEERENYALEKFWNHSFKIDREAWLEESVDFAKYEEQ